MDLSVMVALEPAEIEVAFHEARAFGGNVTRMNQIEPKPFMIENMLINSDKEVCISFESEPDFNEKSSLLISLNFRDIVFRLSPGQFRLQDRVLIFAFPEKMRGRRPRIHPRHFVPLEDKIVCRFQRIERRGGNGEFAAETMDYSKIGLGLQLKVDEEDAIKPNDHLWIKEIMGTPLAEPVFAKVVYMAPLENQQVRLGISLQGEIPQDIFESLFEKTKLILA